MTDSSAYRDETDDQESVVLILEDDGDLRELYARCLRRDHRVLKADRVTDAEELLATNEVDVVLSDHTLPGEDGLDFLARLRTTHPNIQRILLTAHVEEEMFLKAINEGHVYRYLVKTSDLKEVSSAVAGALKVRRDAQLQDQIVEEHGELQKEKQTLPAVAVKLKSINESFVGMMGTGVVSIFVLLIVGVFAIVILYILKSAFHIDVFSDLHFSDLF